MKIFKSIYNTWKHLNPIKKLLKKPQYKHLLDSSNLNMDTRSINLNKHARLRTTPNGKISASGLSNLTFFFKNTEILLTLPIRDGTMERDKLTEFVHRHLLTMLSLKGLMDYAPWMDFILLLEILLCQKLFFINLCLIN